MDQQRYWWGFPKRYAFGKVWVVSLTFCRAGDSSASKGQGGSKWGPTMSNLPPATSMTANKVMYRRTTGRNGTRDLTTTLTFVNVSVGCDVPRTRAYRPGLQTRWLSAVNSIFVIGVNSTPLFAFISTRWPTLLQRRRSYSSTVRLSAHGLRAQVMLYASLVVFLFPAFLMILGAQQLNQYSIDTRGTTVARCHTSIANSRS